MIGPLRSSSSSRARSLSFSVKGALPALLALLSTGAGCANVVVDVAAGGSTGESSTTTGETTTSTTTTETTSTTTTTTTTTMPCACRTEGDCPDGSTCKDCQCLPLCEVVNCICVPDQVVDCYSGPPGTSGVGLCKNGKQTCHQGLKWGPCEGEILPGAELCDGFDSDCNGIVDDGPDEDGDGWTTCQGDCCDNPSCAEHPELINPGAIEIPGNGLDDDCNIGTLDTSPFADCTGPALDTPTSSVALIKAMDVCQFTVESPPLEQQVWGVISAELTLADGSLAVAPADVQAGVLSKYGPNVLPQAGATMAALSTGTARGESDPGFVYPQNGFMPGQVGNFIAGTSVPIPASYLSANGGKVPTPCGSCEGPECALAYDSIRLKMRVRTPTNAWGFSFRTKFYTAEYPENICTQYNDFFVALLDSKAPDIPPDKNVAFNPLFQPLSSNNTSFDVCVPPNAPPGLCPGGSLELVGTGMGGWEGVLVDGAATPWLEQQVPIVPGEIIELQFILWDAIDGNVDSLVLLDRFRWLTDPPKIRPI